MIEPLHVRLRAAAFRAQSNKGLSALLTEAAAALTPPAAAMIAGPRTTLATIERHAAGDPLSPTTYRYHAPTPPIMEGPGGPLPTRSIPAPVETPTLATCGHCGEEYAVGVTHCPECSGRVA
jgi:hypothetical protein